MSHPNHVKVCESMSRVDVALTRLEGHLSSGKVSVGKTDRVLAMIEGEINVMLSQIDTVDKWRRWVAPELKKGPKSEIIPWSLVIGVSIDCFVDGLMVGLTYMASVRAGYIMGEFPT
jgi:hypothetical protein